MKMPMLRSLFLAMMLTMIQPFESRVQAADAGQIDRLIAATGDMTTVPKSFVGSGILTGKDFKRAKNGVAQLPFGEKGRLEPRVIIDQPVTLDVSTVSTFYIDLTYDNPDVIADFILYMQSEKGWYSMGTTATRMRDGKTIRYSCSPGSAYTEGKPTGFNKITTVRLAFYPKEAINTSVQINSIYGDRSTIGVLHPSTNPESPGIVADFHRIIARTGISCATIPEKNLTFDRIKTYPVVIIPIAGRLLPETVELLCDYVDQGGFLITFYGLPAKLMKKLGFRSKGWMRCDDTTARVAKVVFEKEMIEKYMPFLPSEMRQNSGNIDWAVPLDPVNDTFLARPENKPRIAAWWYDEQNQKTQYPAMLWSGRGISFAHVLRNDDLAAKELFLMALCNRSDPGFIARNYYRQWKKIANIGFIDTIQMEATLRERLGMTLDQLAKRHCTFDDILAVQTILEKGVQSGQLDQQDIVRVFKINKMLDEIQQEMAGDYAKKVLKPVATEGRFLWEHSGLGAWPGNWDRTMRELAEAGFNGIITNMCWGGSASYKSDILPNDSNCKKYGDQIAQCVAAGKKYGVEVHVWKVNYNTGWSVPKEFVERMRSEGRLQYNYSGKNDNPWLCPSHPANQKLEVDAMIEIARNYDVDGIHFDYIRFPDANHCFCPGCKERFSKYYRELTGNEIARWPEDTREVENVKEVFLQWRREQITSVVRRVSDSVRKFKPDLKISCAARSAYPGTMIGDAQDWVDWCNKGYLDFVCPMNYTDNYDRFIEMVKRQEKHLKHKVPLYAGIGIVTPSSMSVDMVAAQIELTRQYKTGGFCLFALTPSIMKELIPALKTTSLCEKVAAPHQ